MREIQDFTIKITVQRNNHFLLSSNILSKEFYLSKCSVVCTNEWKHGPISAIAPCYFAVNSIYRDWLLASLQFGISAGVLTGFHTCRWKLCYLWREKKICISLCLGLSVFHFLIQKQKQFTVYADAQQLFYFLFCCDFVCTWLYRPF